MKKKAFIEYLTACLIIYDCNTIYYLLIPKFITVIASVMFLGILVFIQFKKKTNYINLTKASLFLFFYSLYALIIVSFANNITSCIYRFMVIIPALVIYFASLNPLSTERFSLFYKFSTIMILLSSVSLVMWVFASYLDVIKPIGYISYKWGNNISNTPNYYNIYYETQNINFLGIDLIRNSGIFAEAPMHSLCLCMALAIELFLKTEVKKIRILILSITLLTTISTSGYLFIILALVGKFIFLKKHSTILKIIVLPIIGLGVYFVVSALILEKKNTISYESRSNNIEMQLKQWKHSPIFGVGYGGVIDDKKNILENSNSFFSILADGGIYMFSLYLSCLLISPLFLFFKHKNTEYLFMFLSVFYLFSIVVSRYQIIILIFVSFTLSKMIQKRIKSLDFKYVEE